VAIRLTVPVVQEIMTMFFQCLFQMLNRMFSASTV